MYKIISIEKHKFIENNYNLVVNNDAAPGNTTILCSGETEVTLASRWPKEVKDFDLDKHVFIKVRDLKAGDEVTTL